jgi:hypothetical protein
MCQAECVQWVDANKRSVIGYGRKYKFYSPYSEEDFIQEAYIASFKAGQKYPIGTPQFHEAFWRLYSNATWYSLATNPSVGDVLTHGKSRKDRKTPNVDMRQPVQFEEFDETIHSYDTNWSYDYPSESRPTDLHRTFVMLTKHLLKNQKDVFITVLGLSGNCCALNYVEAASVLGKNKSDVFKIFENACRRIKRLVAEGKIDKKSFPRLMMFALDGGKSPLSAPAKTPSIVIRKAQNRFVENEIRLAA